MRCLRSTLVEDFDSGIYVYDVGAADDDDNYHHQLLVSYALFGIYPSQGFLSRHS